jgi:hypothetical protein
LPSLLPVGEGGVRPFPTLRRSSTETTEDFEDEPIDPTAVGRSQPAVGWERAVSYGMGTKQPGYVAVKTEPKDGGTRRCAHCNRRKKRTRRK